MNVAILWHTAPKPPTTRWLLARLIFYPEVGGDTFVQTAGSHMNYTELYPRRLQQS
jgi:hypothetical protein